MAQRLGVSRRWLIEFEHARVPNPGFSTILSALTELGLSLDVRKTPLGRYPNHPCSAADRPTR